MAIERRTRLARLARISKYLIEDAGGIVADVAYAVRHAVTRRWPSRRDGQRRRQLAHRRGRA
jgi:hypothetical protein